MQTLSMKPLFWLMICNWPPWLPDALKKYFINQIQDPKEYIPYIESLKEILDEVEFKKKICLDLKKFDVAIK